jgi:circadian clock protein KaiC
MAHSNQIREFLLTKHGIDLVDVYVGSSGVLTGSARLAQEGLEKTERTRQEESNRKRIRESQRRRKALEAQIAALRAEYDAEADEIARAQQDDLRRERVVTSDRAAMARKRFADTAPPTAANGGSHR